MARKHVDEFVDLSRSSKKGCVIKCRYKDSKRYNDMTKNVNSMVKNEKKVSIY